jgi:hypothetical protein
VGNIASPPTLNLLGELFIYMVGASINIFFFPLLMLFIQFPNYTGMIFFSKYLTNFKIPKVAGHCLKLSKMEVLKWSIDGFSYFC